MSRDRARRRDRQPEPYQRYRQPLQQKWRGPVLERDGCKCRACGASEKKAALHLAHITDAVAFVRAGGDHRAVTFSYRWDNLYTLCVDCHRASHRFRSRDEAEWQRRVRVHELESQLRRLRGWSSPFAVLPPHMVPERLRPQRSFHDVMRLSPLVPFPTFARYASDGGLVFGDQEAPPRQARLFRGPDAGPAGLPEP